MKHHRNRALINLLAAVAFTVMACVCSEENLALPCAITAAIAGILLYVVNANLSDYHKAARRFEATRFKLNENL